MSEFQLYTQFNSLPADLKKEVENFIAFLKKKSTSKKKIKHRKFGIAKGFFKMSPDFDAPLNDFSDYMK